MPPFFRFTLEARMKKYLFPLGMWLVFEAIAVTLWLATGTIFYFFNFTYIGSCIAIGIVLYIKKFPHARQVVQFAVGLYMFVYLGILSRENMQLEGFWYFLFLGVFQAAVIHYAVAKIFGPLLFGRGWCGYACWTAMVLDLLPYKTPNAPRKRIGWIRYLVFAASLGFVGALFLFHVPKLDDIMFWSFLIGNAVYYIVGIALAFAFRDNRAFCKYICPITVFLKPASYFSLTRVRVDEQKCVSCGKCKKVCPMNVDMTDNARSRTNGTECILCNACVDACPKDALRL
jgi:polyferredoxin